MSLVRHPAFGLGVVLLVLGACNWAMGRSKIVEYSSSLSEPVAGEVTGSLTGFSQLDARTNEQLLRSLHRGIEDYRVVEAKLDFYKVVQTGGQLFALLGGALIMIAGALAWHRTHAPGVPAPH